MKSAYFRKLDELYHEPGYAEREYGVTKAELDAFARRMNAELARDRKAGRIKPFDWAAFDAARHRRA